MAGLFDLISVDWYTANEKHSEKALQQLRELSRELKLPVLVAEFGTRQKIKGWTNTSGSKALLESQEERAKRYASQIAALFKEKWIIGAHWFRWQDHITETDQMNKGIVKTEAGQITPYRELKSAIQSAHQVIVKELAE
jgi:preprotein translocase subunit SecA